MPDLLVAARALIEGNRPDSVEALASATKSMADPEAFYYAARHFAHLDQPALALEALTKAVHGGYFCYQPLTEDPWFDPLRNERPFQPLVERAHAGHESAGAAFRHAEGITLLR